LNVGGGIGTPVNATISGTKITGNTATGGAGGAGGAGGNGGNGGAAQGGGLYVDPDSTVALNGGSITVNEAIGGALGMGATDGTDGAGMGGGVFLAATGSTRKGTKTSGNFASTSGNDVSGSFS
jgi:hypothetical protein